MQTLKFLILITRFGQHCEHLNASKGEQPSTNVLNKHFDLMSYLHN